MATNVTIQVIGGSPKVLEDATTVQDAFDALALEGSSYTATINGEPAAMDDYLDDYAFVSFSESVKGGC